MSEPEFEQDDPDHESMFDFLTEGDEKDRPRAPKQVPEPAPSLPVIRRPVPVHESRDIPTPPPEDISNSGQRALKALRKASPRPGRPAGSGDSGPRSRQGNEAEAAKTEAAKLSANPVAREHLPRGGDADSSVPELRDELDDDELDFLSDLPEPARASHGDAEGFGENWSDGVHPLGDELDEQRPWIARQLAPIIGLLVLVSIAAAGYWLWRGGLDAIPGSSADTASEVDRELSAVVSVNAPLNASSETEALTTEGVVTTTVAQPLSQRFRTELARIEGLVAAGSLDEAEAAIKDLDRTVYGYGVAEFSALLERIGAIRDGGAEPAEPDAALRAEAERAAAAQAEAERIAAAEQTEAERVAAAQAEAERVAAEQAEAERVAAAQAEAERVAAEQTEAERVAAAQAEAERVAAEQAEAERVAAAEQAEAERVAAKQAEAERVAAAEQAEAERVAAEQVEAEQLATAQTDAEQTIKARTEAAIAAREAEAAAARAAARDAATARAAARSSARPVTPPDPRFTQSRESDKAATDRRVAEVRQARQQTSEPAAPRPAEQLARAEQGQPASNTRSDVAIARRPITDADLEQVYRRFAELGEAIERQDINSIIELTEDSGAKIQPLLQMFANSDSVDASISNMSTLQNSSSITGVLRLGSLRRPDGTLGRVPASLQDLLLTSRRDGVRWSRIDW